MYEVVYNDGKSWFDVELEGTFVAKAKIIILANNATEAKTKVQNIIQDYQGSDPEIASYDWQVIIDKDHFQPEDIEILNITYNEELSTWELEDKIDITYSNPPPPNRSRGTNMTSSTTASYMQQIANQQQRNSENYERRGKKRRR